jgi:plastocyanin
VRFPGDVRDRVGGGLSERTRFVLVATCIAFLVGACSGSNAGGDTVEMTDPLRFEPSSMTVSVGDTVTFTNPSGASHTVTAYQDGIPAGAEYFASGGFESEEAARDDLAGGLIEPDEEYEVTFDRAGTYRYFCLPHEGSGMTGEIVVEG